MLGPYPWHQQAWQRLATAQSAEQLGHANLFSARSGVGIEKFAEDFARYLLCENKSDLNACGACRGCLLFEAGNHPDLKIVAPVEEGKAISIDQIRELTEFYTLKPHYGGYKVSIICPLDAMNRAGFNALLKTLEEPPSGAVLLLLTNRFDAVPMTIRSRCQRLALEQVDQAAAMGWLNIQGASEEEASRALSVAMGAPLTAQELINSDETTVSEAVFAAWRAIAEGRTNPLVVSKSLGAIDVQGQLNELQRFVYCLQLSEFGFDSCYGGASEGSHEHLKALLNRLDLKDLYRFLDLIVEAKGLLLGGTNLRESDVLDTIWLELAKFYENASGV